MFAFWKGGKRQEELHSLFQEISELDQQLRLQIKEFWEHYPTVSNTPWEELSERHTQWLTTYRKFKDKSRFFNLRHSRVGWLHRYCNPVFYNYRDIISDALLLHVMYERLIRVRLAELPKRLG